MQVGGHFVKERWEIKKTINTKVMEYLTKVQKYPSGKTKMQQTAWTLESKIDQIPLRKITTILNGHHLEKG